MKLAWVPQKAKESWLLEHFKQLKHINSLQLLYQAMYKRANLFFLSAFNLLGLSETLPGFVIRKCMQFIAPKHPFRHFIQLLALKLALMLDNNLQSNRKKNLHVLLTASITFYMHKNITLFLIGLQITVKLKIIVPFQIG